MKVLFSQSLPFFLAHGGTQTFVEALIRELPELGVEVEPERWWDEKQTGDVIHFVNRPSAMTNVFLAREKGFKLVMTEFLDQPASRSSAKLRAQKSAVWMTRRLFSGFTGRLAWDAYRELDAMVYAVPHEWETAKYLFDATPDRGFVIPHGLPRDALTKLSERTEEGDYLVSVATIATRKNTNLLAAAAKEAKVPIVFVGKPYASDDPYFQSFQQLIDGHYVRYAGYVDEEAKYELLRRARGFALLSQFESGCIAVFEAAAAGLPLFLSNLPWATKAYTAAKQSVYVPLSDPRQIAVKLSQFYKDSHRLPEQTFPVLSWGDVARKYLDIYKRVLANPRASAR